MPHSTIALRLASWLLALAAPSIASAQVHPSWITVAGNPGGTSPESIALDAGGFGYLASTTPAPSITIRTRKYAPDGALVWSRDWTDPAHHVNTPTALAVDLDGSVYVAGLADEVMTFFPPPPVYTSKFALLKYSATGVLEWSRVPFDGGASAVVLDGAGGVFVAGTQEVAATYVGIVRRYTTAGAVVWSTTLPSYSPYVLAVPTATRLYAAGTAYSASTSEDFALTRLDPATGAIVWSRQLDQGSSGLDRLADMAADGSGNIALAGSSTVTASSSQEWSVVLYDDQGNLHWQRQISGPQNDGSQASEVALDATGRVVAVGSFKYQDPRSYDIVTAVWDNAGNQAWVRGYDSGVQDQGFLLSVDAAGNIVTGGQRLTPVSQRTQGVLLGYDPAGSFTWALIHPDPAATTIGTLRRLVGRGGSLLASGTYSAGTETFVMRLDPENVAYCLGDGSGTACPCGNASAPAARSGCTNTLGVGGTLGFAGASSLSHDSLTLLGSSMTNASALYLQGTARVAGGTGSVFGDGLLCAGGSVLRLATRTNAGGTSQFPSAGDLPLSVRGAVLAPGTRTYQVWYRNAASFCTSATFNLTNGLTIAWRI